MRGLQGGDRLAHELAGWIDEWNDSWFSEVVGSHVQLLDRWLTIFRSMFPLYLFYLGCGILVCVILLFVEALFPPDFSLHFSFPTFLITPFPISSHPNGPTYLPSFLSALTMIPIPSLLIPNLFSILFYVFPVSLPSLRVSLPCKMLPNLKPSIKLASPLSSLPFHSLPLPFPFPS